ncbi:MAG: glyoxylase family protein [Frankiaceae bacterium]|nr:glyoxylase family protein [Frankiaceae bacterium]
MPDLSFTGIHHLELTVRDLERSVAWYSSVLGLEEAARADVEDRTVVLFSVGPLLLGLVGHPNPPDTAFDELRTGLDHVGFRVATPDAVSAWAARLDQHDVAHSGVKDGAMPESKVVIFRDPDNIQLECYYAPRP